MKIYAVLSRTQTKIGKIIRIVLNNKYNHLSLSLDKNMKNMFSFARLYHFMPFVGGLVKETPSRLLAGANQEVYIKILEFDITNQQFMDICSRIYDIETDKEGYLYNLFNGFLCPLKISLKIHKSYICSEFVISILSQAGIINPIKDISLHRPVDIDLYKNSSLYFEGSLADYMRQENIISEVDSDFLRPFSMFENIKVTSAYIIKLLRRSFKPSAYAESEEKQTKTA